MRPNNVKAAALLPTVSRAAAPPSALSASIINFMSTAVDSVPHARVWPTASLAKERTTVLRV